MYFIEMLDYPGAQATIARGLNNKGQAVGDAWSNEYRLMNRVVLWETTYPADVGSTNPSWGGPAQAAGINDSGDIAVNGHEGPYFYRDGTPNGLTGITEHLGGIYLRDINNDGLIAGISGPPLGTDYSGFIYDSKANTPPLRLYLPGGGAFNPSAINNKGQVVGYLPPGTRAGIYSDGDVTDLGPVAFAIGVNDVNDAGLVVGARVFEGNLHKTAYICDTSTGTPQFHDLGALSSLGHVSSIAWSINSKGDVVGQSSPDSFPHAFISSPNGPMRDLNSLIPKNSGWTLHCAYAINDRGQIVGDGYYFGQHRAFLLSPDPIFASVRFDHGNLFSQFYSLVAGTAGVWFGPGTRPGPIDPEGHLWQQIPSDKRDMLIGLAITQLASTVHERHSREDLERTAYEMIRRTLDRLTGR